MKLLFCVPSKTKIINKFGVSPQEADKIVYELEKNDIVIIPAGCVHRPEVDEDKIYSRYSSMEY